MTSSRGHAQEIESSRGRGWVPREVKAINSRQRSGEINSPTFQTAHPSGVNENVRVRALLDADREELKKEETEVGEQQAQMFQRQSQLTEAAYCASLQGEGRL